MRIDEITAGPVTTAAATAVAGQIQTHVIIVFDDIDRHNEGCTCELCDTAHKSYGYAIFDVANQSDGGAGAKDDDWWRQSDPLVRVYAASEAAGLRAARQSCAEKGWQIINDYGVERNGEKNDGTYNTIITNDETDNDNLDEENQQTDKPEQTAASAAPKDNEEFIVEVREVWIQPKKVWASSPAEAIQIIKAGGGQVIEDEFEYSHELPSHTWTISPIK